MRTLIGHGTPRQEADAVLVVVIAARWKGLRDRWITSHNAPNVDFPRYFPDTYVERVRSVPGVARADNLLVGDSLEQ